MAKAASIGPIPDIDNWGNLANAMASRVGSDLLIQIKAPSSVCSLNAAIDWKPISIAPFDRDLELAVIDRDGPHALVFPCRRIFHGWAKVESKERIDVQPTHWREWVDKTA